MTLTSSRLGQTIARARKRQDLTQVELAREIGKAWTTVANLERGASPGSYGTLRLVAARLDLDLDRLLKLSEELVRERSTRSA